MAALDPAKYPIKWMDGQSDRTACFALLNISAADTVDLAAYFSVVRRATLLGVTVAAALAATVNGTVVTIPAGASSDAGILTVYGVASS